MAHDGEYFRQREAEARAAAYRRDEGDSAEVAGQLALAYSALARHHSDTAKSRAAAPQEAEA